MSSGCGPISLDLKKLQLPKTPLQGWDVHSLTARSIGADHSQLNPSDVSLSHRAKKTLSPKGLPSPGVAHIQQSLNEWDTHAWSSFLKARQFWRVIPVLGIPVGSWDWLKPLLWLHPTSQLYSSLCPSLLPSLPYKVSILRVFCSNPTPRESLYAPRNVLFTMDAVCT